MLDLWSRFEATAQAIPDHPAFLCEDVVTTFGQWYRRTNDFRQAYQRLGVAKADRVLLWIRNCPDIAAALTAVWAEGAIGVLLDASAPAAHLDHAINKTSPRAIVTVDNEALPGDEARHLPRILASGLPTATSVGPSAALLPTDFATIVFTSGSTGRPKGVVQSHGNLIRGCSAVASYAGITAADRLLCPVPWSFDYGYGQLLATIIFGVSHVMPRPVNPSGICAAIERHKPTVIGGLPALYSYLVSGMSPIEKTDLSSVRMIMNTGGGIPSIVLARLLELFSHSEVLLNYGLTETYRSCFIPPKLVRERKSAIGIPIPGVDIVIVDEFNRVLPAGEEGEIVHRGDYICHGYWNDPEATARAIRPDPLSPPGTPDPGRALYTGDYGYRDADGFVYFLGRRDHQLKSMGVRVSPKEVEDLLHESGLLLEVAVFGIPHDVMGHEIWAAVVPQQAGADIQRSVQQYARGVMSQYMQPRRFLVQDRLPRTTTGKVDYPALKQLAAAAPAPKLV